jgi:ABC-type nitrate/sulfonate/bicarbonate transport system substrate-binding protein
MNKIIIALGLTLAAATGAFAASPNDYVELNAPTHGPAAEAHAAKEAQAGVDYTATASFERSSTPSTHTEYSLERFNR